MAKLSSIVTYLDHTLDIEKFEDSSHNGLQVAGPGNVRKVCCGVDASLPFLEEAARRKADLVICHHGISWGDSLKRLAGMTYERVACLVKNDVALYACHLPLDAHPRYGNNAVLASELGLTKRRPFGSYHGMELGVAGELPKPMTYVAFKKLVRKVTGNELRTMDYGRKTVRSVAVVSGGAADLVAEAAEQGMDVFFSGEPSLVGHNLAQEHGVNAVFAGHYATESQGVKALGKLLARRFKLRWEFIDLEIPF